jgi:hypothetical protein
MFHMVSSVHESFKVKFMKVNWFRWHIRWASVFAIVLLQACQSQDVNYFRKHPQALFQAAEQCEQGLFHLKVSCERIKKLALRFGELAVSLRQDPQLFGQRIMQLQRQCASESSLEQQKSDCQNQLATHLAVVQWFESPEK